MTAKEDMIKNGLQSPDEADALLACMMPSPQARPFNLIEHAQNFARQREDYPESEQQGERRYFS
jgi:hypothetical protein